MRIILAAVLGAVILFFWGFVSWMVLPWHETKGFTLPDESAVVSALQSSGTGEGLYWVPALSRDDVKGLDKDAQALVMEEWTAKHEKGPIAMIVYHPEGKTPMAPSVFATGIGISFLGALVASVLLCAASIRMYLGRVLFVMAMGLFAALVADMTYWNYMAMPTDWSFINSADHLIGWGLAGLAMAAVIKPKPAPM